MGKWFVIVLVWGLAHSIISRAEVYEKDGRIYFEKKDESSQYMRPFSTDGCTMYGEGTCEKPYAWTHCCIQHDYEYWHGGTMEEKTAADEALSNCVAHSGYPDHAFMMFLGINLFARHSDRWGSGWHQNPGYRQLTEEETEEYRRISPDDEQKQEMNSKLIDYRRSISSTEKLYCSRQNFNSFEENFLNGNYSGQ